MMTTDGGAQAGARLVLDEADYGAAIRAARQQRGLSQRRLAQRCGINVTYLCDIELGRRKPPSGPVRTRIQAETGVCCPTRAQLAAQVAALTAERDAADELRQQQHRAKSIVMDSQQREVVALREQVEALTAERDRLHMANAGLAAALGTFALTARAWTPRRDGWPSFTLASCLTADSALKQYASTPPPDGTDVVAWTHWRDAMRQAATTPPAGAQEHEHDWQPAGFTPHPASGGLMPTDQCRVCGAVRYPYSPDVQP